MVFGTIIYKLVFNAILSKKRFVLNTLYAESGYTGLEQFFVHNFVNEMRINDVMLKVY